MDDRTGKDRDEIWVSKRVWRDLNTPAGRNIRDYVALMSIPPTVHDQVALEEQKQITEGETITAKLNISKTHLRLTHVPESR